MPLAADLHENFTNEESVAETLVQTLWPLGVSRSKLVAAQTN